MITPVLNYEMPSALELLRKKINEYVNTFNEMILSEDSRTFSCEKLYKPNPGCSGTTVLGCQSSPRTKPKPDYCGRVHKKNN